MTRPARPDFLVVGAPKAGTTALHAALRLHPQVFTTHPKEPKFWLCEDAPPPAWRGPGDAHSQQEWIWRRAEYDALFASAGPDQVRGESTPFYLWSPGALHRVTAAFPDMRLIAVVRDPVDRAYSNWMHLWCDGLEPVDDFEAAFGEEGRRIAAGWAPFWRYRELGRYGEQLARAYDLFPAEQILVLRYRDIVDQPAATLDRVCDFLGIAPGLLDHIPQDNSRTYVAPGWRPRVLGPVIRAGARAGAFVPPQVWRRASVPLIARLSGDAAAHRPRLAPEVRARLLPSFADDIARLSDVTGEDFGDWLSTRSRGSFAERRLEARA